MEREDKNTYLIINIPVAIILREHSKMAQLCSIGRPYSDTEEQSTFYKLLKEGRLVYQLDIAQYFFEDFWKKHAERADLLASIKDKDWKNGYIAIESDFILLGKELELNVGRLIEERSAGTKGKSFEKLISIISDALSNRCQTITPIFTITYNLELRFRLDFNSPMQMAKFLQKNYRTQMWVFLEPSRQENNGVMQIQADQITELKYFIRQLRKGQLDLVKFDAEQTTISKSSGLQEYYHKDYILSEVNNKLLNEDVLSIKTQWDCEFLSFLHFLYENWSMYRHYYKQQLTNFLILNSMKSSKLLTKECISGQRVLKKIDLYQAIYPGINYIIQRFRLLLGNKLIMNEIEEKGKKSSDHKNAEAKGKVSVQQGQIIVSSPQAQQLLRKLQIKETVTDRLFHLFLDKQREEIGYKTSIDIYVFNRETVKLKEIIGHCLQFYRGTSKWSDLFSTVSHYFEDQRTRITQPNHKEDHFLQSIEQQQLPNMRCLGCTPFFYYKSNIYCQAANQPLVRVFPSIRKLKDDEAAVKDEICGMLNSGGGFIFFDCERSYRQIVALGQKITQKEKQECQQRIQSYIRHFYPKIDLQSQVCVSFVPLVYGSDRQGAKENYTGKASYLKTTNTYKKRQYLESVFVTRIKVVSLDPSIVYFWQIMPTLQNKDIEYRRYCQVSSQSGETRSLSSRGMLKLIKQKMRKFYIPERFNQEDRRLLKNKASLLDHACEAPDIGSLSLKVTHPKHQKKPVAFEQKYGQMCLIVTNHKSFPRIQKHLNSNGFPCQIVSHFSAYCFQKVRNTGVIYHNSKFQDIFKELQKSNYKVSNKLPIVINVTPYLRLQNRKDRKDQNPLSEHDFRSYCKAFFNEFPNQYIKAFLFITEDNQKEYYLTTQSKLSTVFMYFYLNSYSQVTKLKNPPKLDRMKEEERTARLRLLFSYANGNIN